MFKSEGKGFIEAHKKTQAKQDTLKSTDTFWRNSQGRISMQKIFTNVTMIWVSLTASTYLILDMINGVPLNEFHCVIMLVMAGFGLLYKELSVRFWTKLSSLKIGSGGLEIDFENEAEDEKEK